MRSGALRTSLPLAPLAPLAMPRRMPVTSNPAGASFPAPITPVTEGSLT